jgi:hypothetical protein
LNAIITIVWQCPKAVQPLWWERQMLLMLTWADLMNTNKTTSLYTLQFLFNIIPKFCWTTTMKRPYVLLANQFIWFQFQELCGSSWQYFQFPMQCIWVFKNKRSTIFSPLLFLANSAFLFGSSNNFLCLNILYDCTNGFSVWNCNILQFLLDSSPYFFTEPFFA